MLVGGGPRDRRDEAVEVVRLGLLDHADAVGLGLARRLGADRYRGDRQLEGGERPRRGGGGEHDEVALRWFRRAQRARFERTTVSASSTSARCERASAAPAKSTRPGWSGSSATRPSWVETRGTSDGSMPRSRKAAAVPGPIAATLGSRR